ncbi:SIR2 family protein, partial [Peptoniphilus sp.]|uniref:SIR2 family protein n=1 Tax=Peptoniphilus sp. TaxID=1971214 RepID=UPI003D94C196
MLINNIDYPDELVEAIQNNKLVIFAGAGVSMGAPTSLPSFAELSDQIFKLTNIDRLENEAEEQYLGRVNDLGHTVQKYVCEILNNKNLNPNFYHKTLIELFSNNDVKIVTTNYDLMFEKSLGECNVDIYSYPALPHGDKIKGIIHLHGNVLKSEDIVLTDADFGKAYMYYKNATNFLKQLFESDYIILFVGYSYSDIVLKYFTKALPALPNNKRFIFANESQVEEFTMMGLTPLVYKDGDYEQIYSSISRLSKLVNRDENRWNVRLMELAELIPNKLNEEFNYEIKQIFNNVHFQTRFLKTIKNKAWAVYLFEMGYFDDIFSTNQLKDSSIKRVEW